MFLATSVVDVRLYLQTRQTPLSGRRSEVILSKTPPPKRFAYLPKMENFVSMRTTRFVNYIKKHET